MENRLKIQMIQEEIIEQLLPKLDKKGWICNAWFDPDGWLHVLIYSRTTKQKPGALRRFWGKFFNGNEECT